MLNQYVKGENPLIQLDSPLPNFKHPIPTAKLSLTPFGLDVITEEYRSLFFHWNRLVGRRSSSKVRPMTLRST